MKFLSFFNVDRYSHALFKYIWITSCGYTSDFLIVRFRNIPDQSDMERFKELKTQRDIELIKLFQRDDVYFVGTSRRLFRVIYVLVIHLKEKGIIFPMEVTPTWDSFREREGKVRKGFKQYPLLFVKIKMVMTFHFFCKIL